MRNVAIAIATVISAFGTAAPAATPLSVRDSFRIGNVGYDLLLGPERSRSTRRCTDMFDAGYSMTCRDAALPVGKLYKLRASPQMPGRDSLRSRRQGSAPRRRRQRRRTSARSR